MTTVASRVFADELVSATELNRHPGRVLDRALKRPVTVTRGSEAFALLRREEAAHMADASAHAKVLADLAMAIYQPRSLENQPLNADHQFHWLTVFDKDELDEFFAEAIKAFQEALEAVGSWEEFEAVLHEWQESAIAIGSQELETDFSAQANEVLLTKPDDKTTEVLLEENFG